MKESIKNYFLQRSTWMAFGAAGLVLISHFRPDLVDVAAGVLMAFGLIAQDKRLSK